MQTDAVAEPFERRRHPRRRVDTCERPTLITPHEPALPVVDPAGEDDPAAPLKMANPEIIWASDQLKPHEEGCLSLPEEYQEVMRPASIKVRYLDEQNEIRTLDADGLLAVIIQHEMDHLEGVLFVDHLSALKRNMIIKRLTKIKKFEQKSSKRHAVEV